AAGHTARGVAHDDGELRASIRTGRRGGRVARRGGPADGCAILLPLIVERSGTRRGDREGGCLACGHSLARRLSGDRGRHRRWVDGEGGGIAGNRARGVADDDSELRASIRTGRRGGRVARRGGLADGFAIFLPLVAERSGTRRGNREGGRLACGDGLTDGLNRNRGRDVDGLSGASAGRGAGDAADHDRKLSSASGRNSRGSGVAGYGFPGGNGRGWARD